MCHQRKESNYTAKGNDLTDVTNDDIREISDDLRNAFQNYQNAKRMKHMQIFGGQTSHSTKRFI